MLFLNVAFHIFRDVFDSDLYFGPGYSLVFDQPLSVLLLFVSIAFFGSFGSFFIMISGTGNTVSMYAGFQKGKSPKQVVLKQIIGGIILLVFSFLVEGLFQYWGYFGTIFGWNGNAPDPTRILWHAYAMTPVHCLAVSMIVTGIVEAFLSMNKGHLKYNRNILVYIVLSVIVVIIAQPIWDYVRIIGGPGYPTGWRGDGLPSDYVMFMPPPDASFLDYIKYFFMTISAGSGIPIFPFLAMGFVGNIIGIVLIKESQPGAANIHTPKKGMLAGFLVIIIGIAMIPIVKAGFGSIIPVSVGFDISKMSSSLWLPWWCLLLGGQTIMAFLVIRLTEYRGIGAKVAEKTKFYRRFGMPAFSVYAWHRFWAIPIIVPIAALAGQAWDGTGGITGAAFPWWLTIITIVLVMLFCGLILWLWEKIGYIGGIEWMMGEVAAIFGKTMQKSKSTQREGIRWWEHGKMDVDAIFYKPHWIDIIPADEKYHEEQLDSKLAAKLTKLGFVFGLFSITGLIIGKNAVKTEGSNPFNKQAIILGLIGVIWMVAIITVLSLITL